MGLAGSKNSSSLLVILLCVSETCVRLYKRPRHVAYIAWSDTFGRHISGTTARNKIQFFAAGTFINTRLSTKNLEP